MGHLLFLILHVIALLFGRTVPVHHDPGAPDLRRRRLEETRSQRADSDHPRGCPDCREFVLKEATVCKHCDCKLVPQP
jgi:hypothetical protein